MITSRRLTLCLILPLAITACCRQNDTNTQQGNDLAGMDSTQVSAEGTTFQVWIARTTDQRSKGLMFVEAEQMAPLDDGTERGMLFVFDSERHLGFFMKNTVIPLDIAYARTDGTIVKIHTMTPLDESLYSSGEPARFALEVNAGVFSAKGIEEGDVLDIPESVLNPPE